MASKDKVVYVCSNCGEDFPKWLGRCPSCGEWDTLKEFRLRGDLPGVKIRSEREPGEHRPVPISQVSPESAPRMDMRDGEFNRVLGGGLVKGSLVLMGGEPGIGKSTLVLQSVVRNPDITTLYVSGEESMGQIRIRSERITDATSVTHCLLYSETDIDVIIETAQSTSPDLVVIDSIQTMHTTRSESAPGSLSQVRECTSALMAYAKHSNTPVIIIGHITKDGEIAGPKIMEHLVDTVLRFEGDRNHQYRILRSLKNRFGNTSEIGLYEMKQDGLRQVTNPSEMLLSSSNQSLSGVCIGVTMEGIRPLLIEVQALVSTSVYNYPQHSATGTDLRRANMLLAVLEKRANFNLAQKDVFLNITGGLYTTDPGIDLAILVAVLSSSLDLPISRELCVTGEVGLSGEVRAVTRIEQRIAEAEKIGFKEIIIPRDNAKNLDLHGGPIRVIPVGRVDEAFRQLFKK